MRICVLWILRLFGDRSGMLFELFIKVYFEKDQGNV